MGICDIKEPHTEDQGTEITINDFTKHYAIGNGGFGRVWKVKYIARNSSKYYAMKEMSKARIYSKNSITSIRKERFILEKLNFPLLINMRYAFQTREFLYIIMDFLSGGDWRYMMCRKKYFTEIETKFIAACVILSWEYIHCNHVIHRDLKPENLVFDSKGFLHLTDFGVAYEYYFGDTIIDTSGTLGYMAPEVINKQEHNFAVDYFALGVIVYELMLNKRPYSGRNRKEIKEQMWIKEIKLKPCDIPYDHQWEDKEVVDFINKLLTRKPQHRLGSQGINKIKFHPWWKDIDWGLLSTLQGDTPFTFKTNNNFDEYFANKVEDDSSYKDKKEEYVDIVNSGKYFKDFYFNGEIVKTSKTLSSRDIHSINDKRRYNNGSYRVESSRGKKYIKRNTFRNSSNNSTNNISPFGSASMTKKYKHQSVMNLHILKIVNNNNNNN